MIYNWKKIVKLGIFLLTITVMIEIFAGQILQNKLETLLLLPIFLISIPVINSVSGNIGSVLGARLASGLHVGYITLSLKDKEMHDNLLISLFIGVFTYTLLAIVIYSIASLTNLTEDIVLPQFVAIFVVTGVLLVLTVALVSILSAFISFKRGLDPDDVVAPIVTTVGDVMGIVFLFIVLGIFGVGI